MNHSSTGALNRATTIQSDQLGADQLRADQLRNECSELLDELCGLKSMLEGPMPSARHQSPQPDLDLAILDDVIPLTASERVNRNNLLDLSSIFEDEIRRATDAEHAEPMAAPAGLPAGATASVELELIVQRMVDELVPQLEDRLRQQLMALSPDVILELAEQILDS